MERNQTPVPPTDAELLAALAAVLDRDETAPPDAVEAAVASFSWQQIDAELELLYDSYSAPGAATRHRDRPRRELTFTSPALNLEILVSSQDHWLVAGTLTPPARYRIELHQGSDLRTAESDSAGYFEASLSDAQPFRLVIDTGRSSTRLMTPWIDLDPG